MKFPEAENTAYDSLRRILLQGAYSSVELDRTLAYVPEECRAKVTALIYGVLDKNIALDYVISALTRKKPKNSVSILLKLGLYEILYGNDPDYAAADRCVELAKARVRGAEGFVNAVLRAAHTVSMPTGDDPYSVSVRYSRPEWLVKRMTADFGRERTLALLDARVPSGTHIRRNSRFISEGDFARKTERFNENIRTPRGYYVTRSTLKTLDPHEYTAQSLSSIYAAEAYVSGLSGEISILDMCAAPGGKSVYMSELLPDSKITACDVHEHRVRLIRAYAERMGAANVTAVLADARNADKNAPGTYDLVVCDVPCTGSGLICSSPDILLGKTDGDVDSLSRLQSEILEAAAGCVASGGRLAYSTCSLLTEENEAVTDAFLRNHPEFAPVREEAAGKTPTDGKIRLFPDTDGCDGFYIARFTRN